jgi:hypothetical protein
MGALGQHGQPGVHKIELSESKQNVTHFHLLICNFLSRSSPFVRR